ncbi:MAG: folate-binding protein [Rubrivivax sp.]|jgi:folate-binding protein YgfZ|nr:folate-binding protein [Rubrivivax sp.]
MNQDLLTASVSSGAAAAAYIACGAVPLSDWGVIEARGEDSASFLHSQLTNSVQGMTAQRARLAGYCSAKGRLLASFVVVQPEPHRLWLLCSADLLAPTAKRLSMFVLRARCKLADASAQRRVWGLVGQAAAQWLGPQAEQAQAWQSGGRSAEPAADGTPAGCWVRLPDVHGLPRFLWLDDAQAAPPPLPSLNHDTWRWLEVGSAVPRVVAATVEHFVPQMVNLELVGGVDFQKGCYPGQEVVARSQYRGTIKRRMVLMRASGPLQPGADVVHPSDPGQPAGEVVLAAPAPAPQAEGAAWHAVVEVKLAAVQAGLKFLSGGVDMEVSELPYPLPAEAA